MDSHSYVYQTEMGAADASADAGGESNLCHNCHQYIQGQSQNPGAGPAEDLLRQCAPDGLRNPRITEHWIFLVLVWKCFCSNSSLSTHEVYLKGRQLLPFNMFDAWYDDIHQIIAH